MTPLELGEWLIHKVGWGWAMVVSTCCAVIIAVVSIFFMEGVLRVLIFSISFAFAAFFSIMAYLYARLNIWDDKNTEVKK